MCTNALDPSWHIFVSYSGRSHREWKKHHYSPPVPLLWCQQRCHQDWRERHFYGKVFFKFYVLCTLYPHFGFSLEKFRLLPWGKAGYSRAMLHSWLIIQYNITLGGLDSSVGWASACEQNVASSTLGRNSRRIFSSPELSFCADSYSVSIPPLCYSTGI